MGVIAPWCLAAGLLVSFSADAGQDATFGATRAPLTGLPVSAPRDLIPASGNGIFGLKGLSGHDRIRTASLILGDPSEFSRLPDEQEPRIELKHRAASFPSPDRAHRTDPFIGLRPTFDSKLRGAKSFAAWQAEDMAMSSADYVAYDGFAPSDGMVPGPESVARFDNGVDADTNNGTTGQSVAQITGAVHGASTSAVSGSSALQVPALRFRSSATRTFNGSTPAVPRAVALSSATPAPADAVPIEVVAVPRQSRTAAANFGLSTSIISKVEPKGDRPNFAGLIEQDQVAREEKCLAEAIYFESRSEPEEGQAAVAQVIFNRVKSGLYPTSVCGVVYQNRHRHNACQFSFACEGKSLRITDQDSWAVAKRIARDVTQGTTYVADVGDSTHYHANYVRPRWARALRRMDKIGNHIFYQLKPGQT